MYEKIFAVFWITVS